MGWFDQIREQRRAREGGPGVDRQPQGAEQPQGQPQGDIRAEIEAFIQGKPPTAETINALYEHLKAKGYNVEQPTHAGGSKISQDKIVLPGGQVIDLIKDVGGVGAGWMWGEDGYWVDGKPSQTPGYYTPPAPQGGGGPFGNFEMGLFTGGGQYPLASVMGEGLMRPFDAAFKPPDVTEDPGYQFRLDQGTKNLMANKSAEGTLRTGGALKDLMAFGQGLASQEYQNAYDRAWQQYMGAFNIFNSNQANQYGRLRDVAGMGLNATGYAA